MRALLGPIAAAALLVPMLSTGNAFAQHPHHRGDGARFRGGIGLEVGPLIGAGSGATTHLSVGLAGHLGAQINHNWGVYAVPSFDIAFVNGTGVNLGAAVLADYTLNDMFSFGAGPDVGVFATIGGGSGTVSGASGALYGGRLHFAWYPVVDHADNRPRRKGLAVGLDLRLLGGPAASATVGTGIGTISASTRAFFLSPMITVAYEAF